VPGLRLGLRCSHGCCLLGAACRAGAWRRGVGRLRVGCFGVGRLDELFGKALVLGACGVKVAFCTLGADAQCVAGLFQSGDAGVGGGGELVECVPVVGADAGGLVGCGGLGVLGSGDGGGFGMACSGGVPLGMPGACLGVGDLAGGVVLGDADIAGRVVAGLADLGGCAGADCVSPARWRRAVRRVRVLGRPCG
jgi:hypothetical protein